MILAIGHDPGNNARVLKGAVAVLDARKRLVAPLQYKQPSFKLLAEFFTAVRRMVALPSAEVRVLLCTEGLFVGPNVETFRKLENAAVIGESAAEAVFGAANVDKTRLAPSAWHLKALGGADFPKAFVPRFAIGRAEAITKQHIGDDNLAVAVCLADVALTDHFFARATGRN